MLSSCELVMLINTCDKYSDLWDDHIRLLNENWTSREFQVYLVTDRYREISYDNVKLFAAGDNADATERLRAFFAAINCKYILYSQDDYYPTEHIDSDKIKADLYIMDKYNVDYLRLFHYPHRGSKVKNEEAFYYLRLDRTYDVNLYPGIWRKSFFESVVSKNISIWELETTLTQYAKQNNMVCMMSRDNDYPFLDVVEKGKLHYPAVRYFKKNHIKSDRKKMNFFEEIYFQLTFYSRSLVPKSIFKFVKNVLKCLGYKFYAKDY